MPLPLPEIPSISAPGTEFFVQGITADGKVFRPSDWAERLAGVMSGFRPEGMGGTASHLGYSPWCVPTMVNGIKCVVVNRAIQGAEPLAWDFVMNFARDNNLVVTEACFLPGA